MPPSLHDTPPSSVCTSTTLADTSRAPCASAEAPYCEGWREEVHLTFKPTRDVTVLERESAIP